MAEKKIQVLLNFDAGSELDSEEKERVTRQLREELLGLDVDGVDFVKSGKAPAKAKAGDPITWGGIAPDPCRIRWGIDNTHRCSTILAYPPQSTQYKSGGKWQ